MILSWGDALENGKATHSSILAWRIAWTEEPDGLQSVGSQKSQTRLSDQTTTVPSPNPISVRVLARSGVSDSLRPVDCSPPGSSVHGSLQARTLEGLPWPPPGDLPDPGMEPTALTSPALTGGFLATSATQAPAPGNC